MRIVHTFKQRPSIQPQPSESELIVADWQSVGAVAGSQSNNNFYRSSGSVYPNLNAQQLLNYYIYCQPIANAVDVVPTNALKTAPVIKPLEEEAEDVVEIAQKFIKEALPVIRQAVNQARIYGWSIIPIFTDDGAMDAPPMYKEGVTIEDIRAVAGGMSFDASVSTYWDDPRSRHYATPYQYTIPPMMTVNADRCILLKGIADERPLKQRGSYSLGYSIIEPIAKAWENYQDAICSALKILDEKSIDVIKIPGFRQILRKPRELEEVLSALRKCRKAIGGYVLDSEGDYAVVDRSLTGLNDAVQIMLTQVSMQANLSDTLLFGISPAGLTSGSYEESVLAKLTSIYQSNTLEAVFRQLIDTMFKCLGREDLCYELEFLPISETTETQEAEIDMSKADAFSKLSDALNVLVANGLMKAEVAAAIAAHSVDGINDKVVMSQIGDGDKKLLGERADDTPPDQLNQPAPREEEPAAPN